MFGFGRKADIGGTRENVRYWYKVDMRMFGEATACD
jgi:hypothetical protein